MRPLLEYHIVAVSKSQMCTCIHPGSMAWERLKGRAVIGARVRTRVRVRLKDRVRVGGRGVMHLGGAVRHTISLPGTMQEAT